jgi:hypothetical protein
MTQLGPWVEHQLADQPTLADALRFVLQRGLVNLDPWLLLTSDDQAGSRTEAVNRRYPARRVLCFAARLDTDDVACVVLDGGVSYVEGQVLVVHDFATPGSEVDAVYPEFWGWFRAAIDDAIEAFVYRDEAV